MESGRRSGFFLLFIILQLFTSAWITSDNDVFDVPRYVPYLIEKNQLSDYGLRYTNACY
jgi:hypothetical protein